MIVKTLNLTIARAARLDILKFIWTPIFCATPVNDHHKKLPCLGVEGVRESMKAVAPHNAPNGLHERSEKFGLVQMASTISRGNTLKK